jgi:hypothetical protein
MEDLYLRSIEQLRAPVEPRPERAAVSYLPAGTRGGATRGALRFVGGALVWVGEAAMRAAGDAERSIGPKARGAR